MSQIITVPAPLPLKGSYNTRELGGYRTTEGKTTRIKQILRSDSLQNLTEADEQFLYEYGVRCVVDLRAGYEISRGESKLRRFADVEYHNIPLLDHMQSSGFTEAVTVTLEELYKGMLREGGASIARALRVIAAHPGECVLFNCTAGKDRTGMLGMLLLLNAGVPEEVVVADYAATEANIASVIQAQLEAMRNNGIDVPMHLLGSEAGQMRMTIDFLQSQYSGVEGYLHSIGITEKEAEALRIKLLD